MTDLIDRQALLRELSYANWGKDWDEALAKAIIENMPQAQQWVSVSEELPEKDTDILATYVDGEEARIVPVNYGEGTWYDCIFNSTLDSHKVVAWMPLPESYKGDEQ